LPWRFWTRSSGAIFPRHFGRASKSSASYRWPSSSPPRRSHF